MFGLIILYMEFVYALYFIKIDPSRKYIALLFNLEDYGKDTVNTEFFKLVVVLVITVFEIYFIDILKTEQLEKETQII